MAETWTVQKILQVSNKPVKDDKRSVFYKVQYQEGDKAWIHMDNLRVDDPHLMIEHAVAINMLDSPGLEWMTDYLAYDFWRILHIEVDKKRFVELPVEFIHGAHVGVQEFFGDS